MALGGIGLEVVHDHPAAEMGARQAAERAVLLAERFEVGAQLLLGTGEDRCEQRERVLIAQRIRHRAGCVSIRKARQAAANSVAVIHVACHLSCSSRGSTSSAASTIVAVPS